MIRKKIRDFNIAGGDLFISQDRIYYDWMTLGEDATEKNLSGILKAVQEVQLKSY